MRVLLFLAVATLWVSCAVNEQKAARAPMGYDVKTYSRSSPGCEIDSSLCAEFKVAYPIFFGIDSAVQRHILSRIEQAVARGNSQSEGSSMEQTAASFISGFEEFNQTSEGQFAMDWYYSAKVTVETMVDTLISLSVQEEYFTGGAHGGAGRYFININPQTNKEAKLEDFLAPGATEALRIAGEESFRMVHGLPEGVSLLESGFEFPDDEFRLNENYGFLKEGIAFFYNSYEIAPYAVGPTQIVIPYEVIKKWRADSVD